MKRLSLMVSEELFERVELARGDVARERWLRRAVERALADVEGSVRVEADAPRMSDGRDVDSRPAPAEQPETWREALADRSAGANPVRPFSPYPKGGKR